MIRYRRAPIPGLPRTVLGMIRLISEETFFWSDQLVVSSLVDGVLFTSRSIPESTHRLYALFWLIKYGGIKHAKSNGFSERVGEA